MGKEKSGFQIGLEYYPFALIVKILRSLTFRRGTRTAEFLMKALYLLDGKHRKRTVAHILHAGVRSSREEAVRLARACYRESGKLLAEILFYDRCFDPEKVKLTAPPEVLERLLPEHNPAGPRNVILVMAHYGNWEIAGNALARISRVEVTSIMRPFSNPKIGAVIMKNRMSSGHRCVDKRLGVRPLLRALNSGGTAVILIDQHAGGSEGVVCEFFGHPAKVHKTPALLHLKTRIPILPAVVWRDPRGEFRFEMRCGDLIRYSPGGDKEADVARVTQSCISALEKLIRPAPEQWLWAPRHWLDIDRKPRTPESGEGVLRASAPRAGL